MKLLIGNRRQNAALHPDDRADEGVDEHEQPELSDVFAESQPNQRCASCTRAKLIARALAMDGTCTSEHGVGKARMEYLAAEHGEPALAASRAIKRALDPDGIINPGKTVAMFLVRSRASRRH